MTRPRLLLNSLMLLGLAVFPLLAHGATTTDFRVLFNDDNNVSTGCLVAGLEGVDQVLITRVETGDSTAKVTSTFRQVCQNGALTAPVALESQGWNAGYNPASGKLLVETRIPFSAFAEHGIHKMRIAIDARRGSLAHVALTSNPGNAPVFFPAPSVGRRRAVGIPGDERVITLDGLVDEDWLGIKPKFDNIGAQGTAGLRMLKLFGFADVDHQQLYFQFEANVSTDAPFAKDDAYTRTVGQSLTVPGVQGDPTVLANDTDPNGLPLKATLVSQTGAGEVVLDETGGFTYTPVDPASTTPDSFEYQASNNTKDSNVAKVTISVGDNNANQPNKAPSFTKGPDVFVTEDMGLAVFGGWATGISAGAGEADQTVSFVITNNSNPGLFANPPTVDATGKLSFKTEIDANGFATITLKITDNGGTADGGVNQSATQTFDINVTPVNDPPAFLGGTPVVVLDTDGAQNVPGWATSMSSGPADEAGQALNFLITNDSPGLFAVQPSIAPNGALTYTPLAGQDGIATISVRLHDDGGTLDGGADTSAPQVLILTVEKAPLITSANAVTFVAGQPGTFQVTTTGRPRPSIMQGGTLPAGITFVDGTGVNKGTGVLSGTAGALTGGVYPLTFVATSTRGSSPIQNFTLTINQAPSITSGNVATFTRNAAGTFTITTLGFPTPSLSLLGSLPTGLSFTDNGNGTATISGTPTSAGGSFSGFTVTASNGVGSNAVQNLTVVVNELPTITSANATGFAATVPGTFTVTTTGFPAPALTELGALPAGITFTDNGNGTATLGGTAVQGSGGVFNITITATNAAGSVPQSFTITVCNQIAVGNPATSTGTVGSPFSQNFTQTSAVGSATFTTASTLPAGLTLATNGTLSGTPTQFGTFPIVVTVTDANGCTGTGSTYTLIISCQTITVTNPATTTGTASSAFNQTFTQVGAIGGATFSTSSTLPAGLTLSSAGVLSGTPTQTGTFPIVVMVTDGNGCTGVGPTYTLVVGCQTITVNNPATTTGTAAAAFSQTFTQVGAIGTPTFTLASGTLPNGLTLASNGTLSGVPTQVGSFPITVTATDANGCTGTGSTYTLVIGCQVINVTNPATTTGTAGAAFSQTFTQTGAIGTATFTLSSGSLPTGLTLATNGTLSGTPTQTGSFPITVTATDSNGCTGVSSTYTLVINCQTITVTNPSNANGTISAPMFEAFGQTGAIGTATFATASTLPAGLTLNPNGSLTGTPLQTGSFPIVVTVTDSNGCTGTGPTYNLVIACQVITVTKPVNANGTANAAFSETFTQSGAIGTATFTTASTLPAGLTLATNGVLSGTPTQTGSFPIVVTVTDSNGCTGTSSTYNLVIACQTISVNNPANANGTANAAFSETFTQTGAIGSATFTLATGTLPAGLTLATNGVLSGTPTQTGSFPITVTVTDANGCTGVSLPYTIVIACQSISVTNPVNATGTAASAFSETFTQTGGIGTVTFTLASGTLPAGLTLASNGVLSGIPTQTGSFPITVKATDANGCTGTGGVYTIVIGCQVINVTNPVTTTGTVSAPFSQTFTQTGAIGTPVFTTASTLPTGLTLATNGTLSGTPTQTGSFPIVVSVTDGNGCTGTSSTYTLVIGCQTINVSVPANPNGTVSAPFSEIFTQTGAVGTATFTTASTLPAGLTLATNGTLSGTPTQSGSFPITVTVTDSNGCTGTSGPYNLVIACQLITVTNPGVTSGPAGTPFSQTFTQTGAIGTATFTTASTLPTGLTLAPNGVLSGTPNQGGTFPIVVTVTDSNGCTGTGGTYTLTITCPVITVTNPVNANGTANSPFNETFSQTGAIGGATFSLASGSLPAGLTLSAAGVLSGTPTQTGSFPITVKVTDGNGCTGTGSTYTIVIACQTITVTNPVNANGTANAAFSETFTQVGSIGTATFSINSGTLPAGLTLSSAGVLSGTPTQTGSFPITVKVTDSNGCTGISATYTIVIACQTISVTNPVNATGTILVGFNETFTQTGSIGTATFSINSGSLPAGLTLSAAGVLSGTPTVTGTFPITVKVTDSNGCTGVGATYTIVINCQTITVTNPGVSAGTVNAAFSQTFTQTGANLGATFTINTGTLPNGLTLSAAGVLSGTPTQTGSFPITVKVTDGNGCTGISPTYTLVIGCQSITVTNPATTTGTAGTAFSQTFTQLGGFGTTTFSTASTLPTGLTLAPNGTLSGTPSQTGSFPIVVTATDSNGCTGTGSTYTLVISCQTISVTVPGVSTGTVDAPFSQSFNQTGAIGTATFTLDSGSLPSGLTLSAAGVLSGSPGQPGSFPITVKVTDSNGCTGTSATYTLVIACQLITVNNPVNANGTAGVAFSETFTQTGVGTHTPATFTLASGTLPAGLTLSSAGVLSGTPTQNGSFPITVTVTDANGCTGTSTTYNLFIACPTFVFTPTNTMPTATFSVAYSQNISVSGGAGPYTLSLANATTVPTSFTFTNNGNGTATIASANPTVTGNFTFDVNVLDTSSNCTQTQTFSLSVIPKVVNDVYSAAGGLTDSVGNTEAVAAGFSTPTTPFVNYTPSVLANDSAPGGTLTVVTPSVTNAAGTITFNAAGGWSYVPAVNFTGTATFAFTVASNGAQAPASISIVVTNKAWYVKNNAAAGGTGVSSSPFNTLAAAQTASAAGDFIYVMTGDGTTLNQTAGIVLKDNQQLIGAGVALSINGNTLAAAGTKPLITNSAVTSDAITLANGNTVKGLTVSGATRDGIAGNTKAGFTGDTLSILNNVASGLHLTSMTGTVALTNMVITGNAVGLDVNNGTAVINIDAASTITANAGQRSALIQNRPVGAGTITVNANITDNGTGISVANNAAGTVTFAGTLALTTTTNTAISLTTNTGSTINFTGPLTIATTTGSGFVATGGGTLSISGTTNVTTGAAANGININGVTVTGTAAFASLNTTGATTGLALTSIGNGNVTINGGTINAGTGVSLNTLGTSNITLNNVTVTGTTTAITGTTFGTLTISGTVNVSGPTALAMTTGTISGTFNNVSSTGGTNGVTLTGVAGTWGATAGSLTGATGVTFNVSGGSGNITWGGTISQANANRAVSVAASNSATINFNGDVTSSGTSTGVILTASSGTYNFNGATNSFTGASGILISNGQSGTIGFSNGTSIGNVTNTPFQVDGSAVAVTAAITYGGTIAKTSAGALIDVNNLDSPGTLSMTHTPAAAGNLSLSNNGAMGISVINSSSTNITIANASVTFNNAAPGFTSTANTGGTINLQGIALTGSGNRAGMLLAGAGTINVTSGVAAPSINMTGATNNAIDGTTTAFTGTLNLNNTSITGGGATAVRLGGGTLSGTGSTIAAGAQTALNLSGVALTNGAGLNSITSTGGANGVVLANVTGGTYTISGGSLTGNTTAAWAHTNSAANAATISYAGTMAPAINARAIDIGAAGASTGLRGGTITFSGNITTTSNAANANAGGIRVRNSTAGTLTLSGTTISISSNANIGVELTTNPGTTFNFNGGTQTFASTSGKAFTASGGGTVNVTGTNNTITTTAANGLEVIGTAGTHFAGAITFKSINATGGSKGVSLQFFDGPFTIAGDGTASLTSGGTIATMTTRGVELIDVTGAISMSNMTFNNAATTQTVTGTNCGGSLPTTQNNLNCNAAIHLVNATTSVNLNRMLINGSVQGGINGNIVNNLTMSNVEVANVGDEIDENGITLKNLTGSGSASGLNLHDNEARQLFIVNTTNHDLTAFPISGTFSNAPAPNGGQGVLLQSHDAGTSMTATISGSTFSNLFTNAVQVACNAGTSQNVTVTGTTFTNVNSWLVLQSSGGNLTYSVQNNNGTTGALSGSGAINVKTDNAGTATGDITSNVIGGGAVGSGAVCGGGCSGLFINQRQGGSLTANIVGNTIRHVDSSAMSISGGQDSSFGAGKMNVVITGNLLRDPDGAAPAQAISIVSGVTSGDVNCLAATIGGSTTPGAYPSTAADAKNQILGNWDPTPGSSGNEIILFRSIGTAFLKIPSLVGGATAWVQARNDIASVDGTSVLTSGVTAGTCP